MLGKRRNEARQRLGRNAPAEQVDAFVRFRLAFHMPERMWVALQAAEDEALYVEEYPALTADMQSVGLIELRGEVWALTGYGRELVERRRLIARNGWTDRDADKVK